MRSCCSQDGGRSRPPEAKDTIMNDDTPTPLEGAPSNPPHTHPETQGETPSTPRTPPPERGPPADPPAAKTVLEGTKTERELALARRIKDLELKIADLEDENRQLKAIPRTPPPPPPRAPNAPEKASWIRGCTFWED